MTASTRRRPALLLGAALAAAAGASAAQPAGMQPQREAELPWWYRAPQQRVGRYWIKTDLPEDDARSLGRHLNAMHEAYARRLGFLPPRAPMRFNVMIFRDREDYEETLGTRFGIDARGSGGTFFHAPLGSALAFWTGGLPRRRVERVVQHEGFHQFAFSRFGGDLPPWVSEGLAGLFGEAIAVGDRLVLGGGDARTVQTVRDALERGAHVPLRQMTAMTAEQWSQAVREGRAELLYAQAWSMVHFLVRGDGGRYGEPFERYLKLVNRGFDGRAAFAQAFGAADAEAFERRWRRHAASLAPGGFATALKRIEFLAAGSLELARRGVYPDSLDALRDALRAIDFTWTRRGPGADVELRAADSAFVIPWSGFEDLEQRPIFTVARPRPSALDFRPGRLDEVAAMPSVIETKFLDPRDLAVRWFREDDGRTFNYAIELLRRE